MKLTPAKEFRKNREEGVPVELPSTGRRVALRSFTVDTFIATVTIPDELTAYVEAVLISQQDLKAVTPESLGMSTIEFIKRDRAMLELYAQYMFVYPKVRPSDYDGDLGDDEILASDLTYEELLEAYAAVQAPLAELEKFRGKPITDVHTLRAAGEAAFAGQRAAEAG